LEMADLFKAWLPETHQISYEEWSANHPDENEKKYDAWLSEGLEKNILANYPSEQAALSEFISRAESRYEPLTDTSSATTEVAVPIDFSKVIADGSLVPENVTQVRATFTNKGSFQEPVIFTPEFAFEDMAGLPMVPVLAGGNPSVVIVRNHAETKMVEDFNAALPAGMAQIMVANTPEQAVSLLRTAMEERIRRGLAKAGTRMRAIVTAFSNDAVALKNQIGDESVFIATQGWLMKTAGRAGLTAMIERFAAELHAISTAA
jgi:hypothetical protein